MNVVRQRVDSAQVGEIADADGSYAARPANQRSRLVHDNRVDVGQVEDGTFARQPQGDCTTQPRSRAGDESHFVSNAAHQLLRTTEIQSGGM